MSAQRDIAFDPAEDRLSWLTDHIVKNHFLPMPPPELLFCGDGDYRAIGAEFLGQFVRRGGLRPCARVLDIGCGVGRMAVPLTQYLDGAGSYDGVDVVASGINWCRDAIGGVFPAFRFHHLDLHHPLYNPAGTRTTEAVVLPVADGSIDFVIMTSVLTHLRSAEVTAYAREIARVLAPGGRVFVTAFLMNPPARLALAAGGAPFAFDPAAAGPEYHADPTHPMAAVAFDEDHLLAQFLRFGLRRRRPAVYGRWSGRPSQSFQDICIFERSGEAA